MECFKIFSYKDILQISLESWGVIICILSICTYIRTRLISNKKDKLVIIMSILVMFSLLFDMFAWIYRGNISNISFYIVRISNYLVFFINYLMQYVMIKYIISFLNKKEIKDNNIILKIIYILIIIENLLLFINIFINKMYYFDITNTYYRGSYSIYLQMIPFIVFILTFILLFRIKNSINKKLYHSIQSFIILPTLSTLIQIFYYDISFTQISLIISILIIQEDRRFSYIEENIKLNKLSNRDSLLGIYNRNKLNNDIKIAFNKALKNNDYLGIEILDIDCFKQANDTYGHIVGDSYLINVSNIILDICKKYGNISIYRYGGDEFIIIFEGYNLKQIEKITTEFRNNIYKEKMLNEKSKYEKYITISQGIYNSIPKENIDIKQYIVQADQALYKIKDKKNSICFKTNKSTKIL